MRPPHIPAPQLSINILGTHSHDFLIAALLAKLHEEFVYPHFHRMKRPSMKIDSGAHEFLRTTGFELVGSVGFEDASSFLYRRAEYAETRMPAYVYLDGQSEALLLTGDLKATSTLAEAFSPFVSVPVAQGAEVTISFRTRSSRLSVPLLAPTWDEIHANYPPEVGDKLATLMTPPPDASAGRIMIFNGPAGTGKTFAVRALAKAWSGQMEPTCVVDPEIFFLNPSYLLDTMGAASSDPFEIDDVMAMYSMPRVPTPRLIILEDVDELISIDAKTNYTQAVGRLLNLGDGLIGQTADCYLLLTANNDLDRLQSAVIRPGRCRALVDFRTFSSEEAQTWMAERGGQLDTASSRKGWSLAEMYGQLRQPSIENTQMEAVR